MLNYIEIGKSELLKIKRNPWYFCDISCEVYTLSSHHNCSRCLKRKIFDRFLWLLKTMLVLQQLSNLFSGFIKCCPNLKEQFSRQLVYIIFNTNNHILFYLWWKENLLNHQKVWKYYKHDCLQNFLLLFISLLTALTIKNSHIVAGIYFIFLNKLPRPNLKDFQYQMWTSVKSS